MKNTETPSLNENMNEKTADRPQRDRTYWRSFEDLHDTPEFNKALQTEFMSSPLREEAAKEGENDKWARREFLKLMGASVALTTAAGCIRRPVQKIVPYVKQPEEVTLGVSSWYTSSYFDGQEPLGLLVKAREGRPVHIQGNPSNPFNKGAVSSRAQASLLSLYDPERLQAPKRNLLNEKRTNKETVAVSWDDLDNKVVAELQKGNSYLLSGNMSSPATQAVIDDFGQAFGTRHVAWEPLANDEVAEGQRVSYGEAVVPSYRYDKAQTIVSIDADFLGAWMSPVAATKMFSGARKNLAAMNRLYSFDSTYSLTGSNADIRFKIKPSQQLTVVLGLANEVIKSGKAGGVSEAARSLAAKYANAAQELGIAPEKFQKVAADLLKGPSLVGAGGLQTRTEKSLELQIAVNMLNSLLGNDGKTVIAKGGNSRLKASYTDLLDLVKKMNAGAVNTLIIYRANPLYALSESVGFAEALKKVPTVIYIGDQMNETAEFAHYVATDNHALETWGDVEYASGVYGIHQPLIRTMYDTRSFQLSLMTWAYIAKKGPKRLVTYETYYDYLRAFWKEEMAPKLAKGKDFESFWNELLQAGTHGEPATSGGARSFRADALSKISAKKSPSTELELVLYPNVQIGDGTLANIGWLQELPDTVTKIVWDNYASVSLKTAESLHLKEGDIVKLSAADHSIEIPAHIQPGLHDGVVAVAVGYGRTAAGKVGNGVGVDAYKLSMVKDGGVIFAGITAEIKKTGNHSPLVTTQGHDSMEGRQLVVQATNKDYQDSKEANIHRHHTWSIWSGHQYNGHKWGMTIDLNSCTGCSACMTACQSENNIHVVGKKYVMQGREMHWIRIDRYYTGDVENAETVFQPVTCQHCDNAPCETVCPVAATSHTDEGLNDMVYNRCVGTRYCSNNCPYKVRRFNWFNYAKLIEKPMHMHLNPEVTVRPRGVMEKCTFCVQRIKEGKNKAKIENRPLKDGDIKTACESACPADVITFGDLNDENSRVAKIFKAEPRAYALLEEWHARPSIRYMSKIRNNDLVTPVKPGHAEALNNETAHQEGGHA
jgi:molybdopterin-containing oxidoreductase family iron-sulfur binding subunit